MVLQPHCASVSPGGPAKRQVTGPRWRKQPGFLIQWLCMGIKNVHFSCFQVIQMLLVFRPNFELHSPGVSPALESQGSWEEGGFYISELPFPHRKQSQEFEHWGFPGMNVSGIIRPKSLLLLWQSGVRWDRRRQRQNTLSSFPTPPQRLDATVLS